MRVTALSPRCTLVLISERDHRPVTSRPNSHLCFGNGRPRAPHMGPTVSPHQLSSCARAVALMRVRMKGDRETTASHT